MTEFDPSAQRTSHPEKKRLELLAPAGDPAAFAAALDAGADSVYLGLGALNARRGAKNFQPDELAGAVEAAHARGARVYLTLNIDLAEREVGQAARMLELARQAGVDAVLVRDPALVALRPAFPELEFHFSTQTCAANSADVAAAGRVGASRVVLAREMSLAEIAKASQTPDVETEVFVQGALCFSISGRCLLSSWAGGHSGNRGTCTSPCRVPWTVGEQPAGTPLSMRDLAAVHRLDDLRRAGVSALKIEGRLKKAAWVHKAVSLYRRAIDGEAIDPQRLLDEAAELGAYSGRAMTAGYLDGHREELTGQAGRPSSSARPQAVEDEGDDALEPLPSEEFDEEEGQADLAGATYDLELSVEDRGVVCRCSHQGQMIEWSMPKTVVRRVRKAMSIEEVFGWLSTVEIQGCRPNRQQTNAPDFLLVPRAVNALGDRISAAIRQARKSPRDGLRVELPPEVREILAPQDPAESNRRTLGEKPDRVRLDAEAVAAFLGHVRPGGVIVEGATARQLPRLAEVCRKTSLIVALPPVFFEDDLQAMRDLVQASVDVKARVEVNSWGGWLLAKDAGARIEAGPGLPALNALAARALADLGAECVTLSIEADRKQLEDVAAHCPAPCSLVVFGRPALAISRVRLPDEYLQQVFADRRETRIRPRLERGLWAFRPVDPYDLRETQNDQIRVKHLVVDLVGSEDPVGDWFAPSDRAFRFNYDRSLV